MKELINTVKMPMSCGMMTAKIYDISTSRAFRLVAELEGRGVASVAQHDAFESAADRRQCVLSGRIEARELPAARHLDRPPADLAAQARPGALVDFARLAQRETLLLGGGEDGLG